MVKALGIWFSLMHFFSTFLSSLIIILFLNVLHTFPIASVVFAWGKHCLFNKKCFASAYTTVKKEQLLTMDG